MIKRIPRYSTLSDCGSCWGRVQYDDGVYNSNAYWKWIETPAPMFYEKKKKPKEASVCHIDNAIRFTSSNYNRMRFMESYNWCKQHGITHSIFNKNVQFKDWFTMCEVRNVVIPMCFSKGWGLNINAFYDMCNMIGDKQWNELGSKKIIDADDVRIFKDKNKKQYIRYWYTRKRSKLYEECMGHFIELNSMFGIDFDYNENYENGDRIFTVMQKRVQ